MKPIPYKITREKAPLYWFGWAKLYIDVLKHQVNPVKAWRWQKERNK